MRLPRLLTASAPVFDPDALAEQMASFANRPSTVLEWLARGDSLADLSGERITRDELLAIPAAVKGRDLITGTLATLPMVQVSENGEQKPHELLSQPEQGRTRIETLTETIETMILEGKVYWLVRSRRAIDGRPAFIEVVHPDRVTIDTSGARVDARLVNPADLIRLQSPRHPLLITAAKPVRTLALLINAIRQNAAEPTPAGIIETDLPLDSTEAAEIVAEWQRARQERRTGMLSNGMSYKVVQATMTEREILNSITAATRELALCFGIDSVHLEQPSVSRTYQNRQDEMGVLRQSLLPITQAIETRLSLADITPRGWSVAFDWSQHLQPDLAERLAIYEKAIALGLMTAEDAKKKEGWA